MAAIKTHSNEALSLTLCAILNDMGYADKDVQYRIHIYEIYDFLVKIPGTCIGCKKAVGSKITGLSTMTDGGDVDWMIYAEKTLATEDPSIDLPKDSNVFLMEHKNCPPGYCKLVLIKKIGDNGMSDAIFFNPHNFCFSNEKVYLFSKKVKSCAADIHAIMDSYLGRKTVSGNGPAITRIDEPIRLNTDYVYAIPSRSLPISMKKRFSRNRHWPTKCMVSDIAKAGCEVVPVGFPGSKEEDLQWRLSFSTAEKILMQSLNSTQRKTYVLLKIYFKECLKKLFQTKVLSTYIVKMLTLWMCETQPQELWKDNLLVERFLDSLKWLKHRVEGDHFPHYFIKERNMLAGSMTSKDKSLLNVSLSKCIDTVLSCLLKCPSLANKLRKNLSLDCAMAQGCRNINAWNKFPERDFLYDVILNEVNLASRSCKISKATLDAYAESSFERDIVKYLMNEQIMRERFDGMARMFKSQRDLLKNLAIADNCLGLRGNPNMNSISALVKLAMLHIAFNNNSLVYSLLRWIITPVESRRCGWLVCNERAKFAGTSKFRSELKDLPMSRVLTEHCLCEIVFTGDILQLLPKGLRYNLYRFPGMSIPQQIIQIDCVALIYYVQILVCEQLGKEEEANKALAKLLLGSVGKRIKCHLNFEDRETTLNVAGHVYMGRQNYRSAFIAIKYSVFFGKMVKASVYPSFLHLAVLLNKAFEARKLLRQLGIRV